MNVICTITIQGRTICIGYVRSDVRLRSRRPFGEVRCSLLRCSLPKSPRGFLPSFPGCHLLRPTPRLPTPPIYGQTSSTRPSKKGGMVGPSCELTGSHSAVRSKSCCPFCSMGIVIFIGVCAASDGLPLLRGWGPHPFLHNLLERKGRKQQLRKSP